MFMRLYGTTESWALQKLRQVLVMFAERKGAIKKRKPKKVVVRKKK
jgi:hypothetical protein